MKTPMLLILLALASGCSKPADETGTASAPSQMPMATPAQSAAQVPANADTAAVAGAAHGTVESVDPSAESITISHGPVASLGWPAMTMTFKAPDTDLSPYKEGDKVDFEFNAVGMDGTITRLGKATR